MKGSRTYPRHGTQAARLIASLLTGSRVNPLDGWHKLGIYRLADTAFQLRNLGWPVITGTLLVKNKFGEDCRVAEYRLEHDDIVAAGQDGQDFTVREFERREVA